MTTIAFDGKTMKLNDIVTWTGRNEKKKKRFGLIVASDGNKYRVMR